MGIISELRTMKAITAVILLSSVLYGEACIHCPHRGCKPNKPTTTTTDYPTTPDYQDSTTAEDYANVVDRAAIREKTSEECACVCVCLCVCVFVCVCVCVYVCMCVC